MSFAGRLRIPNRLKKKADIQQDHIEIEAFLTMLVSAEKGEDKGKLPPVPSQLHQDREYVIETWLQHRVHHTYPEPGGYNDQDTLLMEDWKKMTLWYIRVSRGAVIYDPNEPDTSFPNIRHWMHD